MHHEPPGSPLTSAAVPEESPREGAAGGGRWLPGLLVGVVFVALALVNTHPLAFESTSRIGHHFDNYFSVWRLAWVAHQLRADPDRLFDANIFYPEPTTLAYSDAMLLPATVLAPLHWLGVEPLRVYNLTLVASFFLNALAAYLLAFHLTRSRSAAALAGIVFAFSPYRFEHFDHLELQFAFWIPLAMLAWHRAVTADAREDYLLVAAAVSAQVLSCIYYGVFLITWLGVLTAGWFVRSPVRLVRAFAVALLPPVILLAVYSLPYLGVRQQVGDRAAGDLAVYSATARDFLSAPGTNVLYGWTERSGANERRLFPGIVAAGLVVVGLWRPLRTRAGRPALPGGAHVRWVHAAGLVLAVLLALGLNGPLYGLLYEYVLPFRGLRVPARATILILLTTSVLAALGLAGLQTRLMHRPRLAAVLVVFLLAGASAEYLNRPGLRVVHQQVSPWYAWLRTIPDAVVFEWPVTVPWRLYRVYDVEYMHRSTLHWRPLVNGYSGNYPDSYIQLLLRMRPFPDTGSLDYLQRLGVTVLIVHEPDPPWGPEVYARAVERLGRDQYVGLIAHTMDSGRRVSFFRLSPRE